MGPQDQRLVSHLPLWNQKNCDQCALLSKVRDFAVSLLIQCWSNTSSQQRMDQIVMWNSSKTLDKIIDYTGKLYRSRFCLPVDWKVFE